MPTQTPLNSKNQTNPFMYHSAFKLSIYFLDSKKVCRPFHSIETKTTIPQIRNHKAKEIQFDRREGYQYCIDLVNKLARKIHVAILFDAYEENIIFSRFSSGKWRHIIEPDFSQNFIQVSKEFSLHNGFVICKDIALNNLSTNPKFLKP
jgi:hypothetical protein